MGGGPVTTCVYSYNSDNNLFSCILGFVYFGGLSVIGWHIYNNFITYNTGYTESHYQGLVQLYNQFKGAPVAFNILAFPCNQFGEQEPETCPAIKRFAESKGVEFTMMNKVDVNGIDASIVYHYLKKVAGPVSFIIDIVFGYYVL